MTQYPYEKTWTKTTEKEALRMIEKEMPEADAQGTLDYILGEIRKGKTITLRAFKIPCQFQIVT